MKNSKILKVVVASSLVASLAATAAISASAIAKVEDIKSHKVGVTGSFNNWGNDGDADVELKDNGSGVYEGVVEVEKVTADMVVEATTDDGTGAQVKTGKKGITFKVRLDGDWTDSWGEYEPAYVRTWNSQTNCCVEAAEGDHVKITVKLDTTKNHPDAVAAEEVDADEIDYNVIPVEYSVEKVEDAAPAADPEPATQTPATTTTDTSNDATAAATPASTSTDSDTTTPATGDTTSAIALVAVVLASLGTAVVMTKKASAKD